MRIAVFGGSFDPPHRGHERILLSLLDSELVDRVRVVPAQDNPFKQLSATPRQRLEMLRVMLVGAGLEPPDCVLDSRQIERPQPGSCTLELMRELRCESPGDEFHFVIGGDLVGQLPDWHQSGDLLQETDFILIPRGTSPDLPREEPSVRIHKLNGFKPLDLSSSEIRVRCENARDCSELLSPNVWDYVQRVGLYRSWES